MRIRDPNKLGTGTGAGEPVKGNAPARTGVENDMLKASSRPVKLIPKDFSATLLTAV